MFFVKFAHLCIVNLSWVSLVIMLISNPINYVYNMTASYASHLYIYFNAVNVVPLTYLTYLIHNP